MRGGLAAALFAPTLLATGCMDAGLTRRTTDSALSSVVQVTESGGPGEPSRDPVRRESRVAAAARQILADLRQGGEAPAVSAAESVAALSRDLDRLQRHVAAAWHFDVDPSAVDFLRVRLRAAIAPDGSVRAIELIDSHGGPEDVLARFVEDAIATLDWSSPLPVDGTDAAMRALVFRFEAGPARR